MRPSPQQGDPERNETEYRSRKIKKINILQLAF